MSKTIDLQIEKSRILIEGLRKNMEELKNKGFNDAELDEMSAELDRLHVASEECDALREQVSLKVRHMNDILLGVKDKFIEKKKVIKGYYPQEQWLKFGVQDKR